MKPVFRTHVPITAAQRTSSGRSCASWTAISEPIESPTRATGGVQTRSMSAATSRACVSMGHGDGVRDSVPPTPRASYVVLRQPGSNAGTCQRRQLAPG